MHEPDWDAATENRYDEWREKNATISKATYARHFWAYVTARGCEIHDNPEDCELPIQAAHILSKSALKRHGFRNDLSVLYDPRNGIGACYRAHRRSDLALERFPAEKLPERFWRFADEVGLRWLAERVYGRQAA